MNQFFLLLSRFFAQYGYGTVFFGVMLENAGLPVPGETVLLFGGFLAHRHSLRLAWVVVAAMAGATVGDNLGYLAGHYGGTALVRRYRGTWFFSAERYDRTESAVLKYGHWAVFVARFITGLRIVAGPLAGAFRMQYPRFLLANFAGAVVWAAAIGAAGYALGSSWQRLVHFGKELDWIALGVAAALVLAIVYRRRKNSGFKSSG
jgi:membrane protein DedA with SNARE-associated domain